MFKLLFRLAILFMLLPGVVFAATNGQIKGTTLDEGGLPIPGVIVTVTSPNLMGDRKAQTDIQGSFFLAQLPPGNYRVVATRPGFTLS